MKKELQILSLALLIVFSVTSFGLHFHFHEDKELENSEKCSFCIQSSSQKFYDGLIKFIPDFFFQLQETILSQEKTFILTDNNSWKAIRSPPLT